MSIWTKINQMPPWVFIGGGLLSIFIFGAAHGFVIFLLLAFSWYWTHSKLNRGKSGEDKKQDDKYQEQSRPYIRRD